ncbi:uncharacterized protein LOC121144121 [Mesocricetus auratus]|uniref:Uncharacterized protein LOC121144121 n=1 Tax=Mesocricetus auratus TaxID=10036 RepID=A0ABM2YHP5_MESAU|nr:uncharacterized protein LOC121144121 [Mesocricetus auratus]
MSVHTILTALQTVLNIGVSVQPKNALASGIPRYQKSPALLTGFPTLNFSSSWVSRPPATHSPRNPACFHDSFSSAPPPVFIPHSSPPPPLSTPLQLPPGQVQSADHIRPLSLCSGPFQTSLAVSSLTSTTTLSLTTPRGGHVFSLHTTHLGRASPKESLFSFNQRQGPDLHMPSAEHGNGKTKIEEPEHEHNQARPNLNHANNSLSNGWDPLTIWAPPKGLGHFSWLRPLQHTWLVL